jgi:TolB-like protein/DNA-binding winged helix-turn-helix (wHTH) protein/Flp pilus assembly protein TadD
MSFAGGAVFRLGQWRVDPALDEISRAGNTVKLEPRTMRVLVCLAERAGEVVSVNQLLDVVWKDLVVTPYSVYQAIAALRRALGDDRKHPTYIANVTRRGYRLVAPIDVDTQTPNPVRPPAKPAVETALDEKRIAAKDEPHRIAPAAYDASQPVKRRSGLRGYGWIFVVLLVVAGSIVWLASRLTRERAPATAAAVTTPAASAATRRLTAPFDPPPHSIAVLPFVNLSGDPSQQYFSDGLTEELLNSLTRINELQVAARTSSFSFQDEHPDILTVGRKLNVAAVLEGSVRRSGKTIRVTAQLNNAVTGFHVWSQTYDRNLGDVLKLQTEIANAVAGALKVTLLAFTKIELGGTHNPAAFDAYLRGAQAARSANQVKDRQTALDDYTEAIHLDPKYALAFAGRSRLYTAYATSDATGTVIRESFDKAEADAREAIRLAPELAEGHVALGHFFSDGALDFTQAREAFKRALALAPGDATVLRLSSKFLASMGQFDESISAGRRAVTLDPLNRRSHNQLGESLYFARRYREAIQAFGDTIALDPAFQEAYGHRGVAYYGFGDLSSARTSCETKPNVWMSQQCLAIVYEKLGRRAAAEAVLAKMRAAYSDAAAYQYCTIYAQWGDRDRALEWLATAMRLRDPGLVNLKTDPLMDLLRKEPRFQAIEQQLRFP